MPALQHALSHLKKGGIVILVNEENRVHEGALVMAAENVTPDALDFMARFGRGQICLPMAGELMDKFNLPPMTPHSTSRDGISTGKSAEDRARSIRAAINPMTQPDAILSPGNVFPVRGHEFGVLGRTGHTEGAIDLMRLAGLQSAAVTCEFMKDDGDIVRRPDFDDFARQHGLPILTIETLVQLRKRLENHVQEIAQSELPSAFSDEPLRVHAFRNLIDGTDHLALVKHPLPAVPLVRVHSECLTGEALGSLRCDCGPQLQESMRLVSESDGGVVIYLRNHEGRGIGLANKIMAYALQDRGHDTIEANTALGFAPDPRDYTAAAHMLKSLGVGSLRLLSNNPDKARALNLLGLEIVEQIPLVVEANPHNAAYLATKRDRMGHFQNAKVRN